MSEVSVIGEFLLTPLFPFFLINVRLCPEKASHQTRIDYKHLKSFFNLVIGGIFASFEEKLSLKNCKISGWQKC